MTYDAIVIGGGPSALSAAIYLGRYKKKTLLITDNFGGLAAVAGKVENYPGYTEIDGFELISKMVDQVKSQSSVEIKQGGCVENINKSRGIFTIKTKSAKYSGKSIIISAGKQPRKLGFEGEDKLIGKGLSYCATCDGPLAKGKEVIVIGGGRSATEAAIDLSAIAKKVKIINIGSELSGEKVTLDKLNSNGNVTTVNDAETKKIVVDKGYIKGINYKDNLTGKMQFISGQMIFVEIGQIPNSKPFINLVKTNKTGEIIINPKTNETSMRGIFASGDITDVEFKQIIIAAGEGAKAAMALNRFLESI